MVCLLCLDGCQVEKIWCIRKQADEGSKRVEKYRPDTLDDVSGHQDILATINKFVDSNVRPPQSFSSSAMTQAQMLTIFETATPPSPPLRSPRNRQNIHDPRPRTTHLRRQEHATNGSRTQRL